MSEDVNSGLHNAYVSRRYVDNSLSLQEFMLSIIMTRISSKTGYNDVFLTSKMNLNIKVEEEY